MLHGVILNLRPARSASAYRKVWTPEGSPLRVYTERAALALGRRLGASFRTDYAMRYGAPSIRARIDAMAAGGIRRVTVISMYPQRSPSTTGSVEDVVAAARAGAPAVAVSLVPAFFDHPLYIAALKASAQARLAGLRAPPERVILSFHGAPKRWAAKGDPYAADCARTAELLRAEMGWSEAFAPLAFQSKFGPEPWLGPPTAGLIEAAGRQGLKRLAVMTPGFLADCLETLDEIAIGGAERFRAAGGEMFTAIPCLNDSPSMIDLLEALVAREAAGSN